MTASAGGRTARDIYGMQLERGGPDGIKLSWFQREDGGTYQSWELRLTEAEAAMVLVCHETLTFTPEFNALLARGAPPL
jgi:hypothetical protein